MNASVYFNNHDPGFNGIGWNQGQNGNWWYQVQQLPADGSYSLPGCPCGYLTAYLYVPPISGASQANGGFACWIIMQDDSGTYSGRQVSPGDVNWQALKMNWSPTFYTSDSSTVQSVRIETDPSQNGGDYSAYAGTWQDAETRTSG